MPSDQPLAEDHSASIARSSDVVDRPGRVDLDDRARCRRADEQAAARRRHRGRAGVGLSSSRWNSSPPRVADPRRSAGRSRRARCGRSAAGAPAGEPPDDLVVVDDQLEHDVELRRRGSAQHRRRARRLRHGAREAVEQEARARVVLGEPVAHHRDGDLVGHRSPASMYSLACSPSGVPSLTLARKMSPVEIFGTPRCSAMNCACVPLPAPGGPQAATSRTSARKPFVVAQLQLALDLLHGLEADADDDQHGGAAEREAAGWRRRSANAMQREHGDQRRGRARRAA